MRTYFSIEKPQEPGEFGTVDKVAEICEQLKAALGLTRVEPFGGVEPDEQTLAVFSGKVVPIDQIRAKVAELGLTFRQDLGHDPIVQ
jgi:hypothetical protein